VFKAKGTGLVQADFNSEGEPILDADTDALLYGVHVFDAITADEASLLSLAYTATATETVPQNLQNLAQVIQAVVGATTKTANASNKIKVLVIVGLVPGAAHSPYKLSLTSSLSLKEKPKPAEKKPETPSASSLSSAPIFRNAILRTETGKYADQTQGAAEQPSPPKNPADKPAANNGPVDCTALDPNKPCTMNHIFQSNDREWWDVSLGITVPGIRQTKYTAPSGKVVASTTTHTDVYAFFDLGYDLQNKGLRWPHLNVGIPVAGQPFYRPFVGVGEWLTPLLGLEKKKFPLRLGVFAGVVFAKQYSPATLGVGSPATAGDLAADLQSHRVTKFLVGLDFSVSELIGRVKPKSK
jgi:hypothetical protein